jgi:7-carboxy-7-deazaguanine synthase
MPRPPILKIAEIFPSFQGEGLRLGEPTIFVRLAGCNLRCAFCDTKYAWRGGAARAAGTTMATPQGGTEATAADVAERVDVIRRLWPAGWVAITGGEPYAQEIGGLIRRLRSAGLRVQIETNGTIYRPWPVDRLTISPKPPAWAYDARFRGRADEIKLVVTRALTPAVVARLRREFPARAPLFLQPQSNAAWSRARALRLAEEAIAEGLGDVRPGIQLHKVYGLP